MRSSRKDSAAQLAALQQAAREMFITRPRLYIETLRARFSNLPVSNFDMGCDFAARGALRDAAMRFRIAVKLDPNFAQAWHNLGACLMQLGDKERAVDAFTHVLALRPGDVEATYLLATLQPSAIAREQWPTRMPRAMVERFFAAAAPYYAQVEAQNNYAGPSLCLQKTLPHLTEKTGLNIVDLGCGVGLASIPWRDQAARITGVDIVSEMLREARAAKSANSALFDAVIDGDLYESESLAIAASSADVVLLCNVAQFLGDMSGVLRAAATWLKPGGIMAITVEPATAQAAYGVNPATGRFGHSAAYLQELAKANGFGVVLQEKAHLYPNVNAGIVVIKKGA